MDKPVFPLVYEIVRSESGEVRFSEPGLTRRELFAALVMQGFMANKERPQYFNAPDDAEWCTRMADALIAELDKGAP